jgi:hypothetical protein
MRVYVENSGFNLNWISLSAAPAGQPVGVSMSAVENRPLVAGVNQALIPAGSRGVAFFDLMGKRVWSFERQQVGQAKVVDLPRSVTNSRSLLRKRVY